MERDRDDLMARHAPTLLLMTSDNEPAHTCLGCRVKPLNIAYNVGRKNIRTAHAFQISYW